MYMILHHSLSLISQGPLLGPGPKPNIAPEPPSTQSLSSGMEMRPLAYANNLSFFVFISIPYIYIYYIGLYRSCIGLHYRHDILSTADDKLDSVAYLSINE